MSGDDVYYRVMLDDTGYHVCCLQWFDEHDYDASKWVRDDDGEPRRFESEMDAEDWLRAVLMAGALAAIDDLTRAFARLRTRTHREYRTHMLGVKEI